MLLDVLRWLLAILVYSLVSFECSSSYRREQLQLIPDVGRLLLDTIDVHDDLFVVLQVQDSKVRILLF